MIISNLTGGLGNQMFQYAFGRYLAIKHNTELKIHFTNALFNTQYTYRLNVFNIRANSTTKSDLKKLGVFNNRIINRVLYLVDERLKIQFNKRIITEKPPYLFNPLFLSYSDNIYFQGYWQDVRYFKSIEKIIRKEFTFKIPLDKKNKEIANIINKTNSISIHVRRGDYVNNAINHKAVVLGVNYYKEKINIIETKVKKPIYFVFSNDIAWCKQNLKIKHETYFINHNKGSDSYRDMQLMSLCKHNIIANSTFSWWGAWLNKNLNKIVIKPM